MEPLAYLNILKLHHILFLHNPIIQAHLVPQSPQAMWNMQWSTIQEVAHQGMLLAIRSQEGLNHPAIQGILRGTQM